MKNPHVPPIESNVYVFPYYGPKPASIYKYPWNGYHSKMYMQLSRFAVENNATSTADGLDYSTFFASGSDPHEPKEQKNHRHTEVMSILVYPFGKLPDFEVYRTPQVASPERKRIKT